MSARSVRVLCGACKGHGATWGGSLPNAIPCDECGGWGSLPATKCDKCGVVVDLDEDGGHIYPDGSVTCPQCEDGDQLDEVYSVEVSG